MKLVLGVFFAAFFWLGGVKSLSDNDEAECDGHPDPHFRNFHNAAFDFQSGCDTVLAKNDNLEIHARLRQMGFYSAIEQIGAIVGGATIVIKASDEITYNGTTWDGGTIYFGGGYRFERRDGAVFIAFPPPPTARRRRTVVDDGGEFSGRPEEFGIQVWIGSQIGDCGADCQERHDPLDHRRLEDLSTMSFTIRAHGSLFSGSQGLCGEWNNAAPGFADRSGIALSLPALYPPYPLFDGETYGRIWQVRMGTDAPILSLDDIPPADRWGATQCVSKNSGIQERHLQAVQRNLQDVLNVDCPRCLGVASFIGTLNCLYDAAVLGCDDPIVTGIVYEPGFMYGETVDADADLHCKDVVDSLGLDGSKSSKGSRRLREKGQRTLRKRKRKRKIPKSPKSAAESSKSKSPKSPKSPKSGKKGKNSTYSLSVCEEMGGECVVYCDLDSPNFDCQVGLCDVDIGYGEPIPVAAFDRYYVGCSCKIAVP